MSFGSVLKQSRGSSDIRNQCFAQRKELRCTDKLPYMKISRIILPKGQLEFQFA